MNIAVILAGGVGNRVGASKPKQFIDVLGKPVIAYTIETFQKNENIDAIEIVCVESHMKQMTDIIIENGFDKVQWLVPGGKDFQDSVLNGINNLKSVALPSDNILVHFGASPFVTDEIINDSIDVCNKKGNAISTTPFYLLPGIKENEEMATKYINRDTIACMSSPHTFKYDLIRSIYDESIKTGIINEVEPHTTSLMFKLGIPIYFSKGNQTNIKITTKEDLDLFEGYVMLKEKREKEKLIK